MKPEFIPLSVPSLKGNELKYLTECVETNWVSSAGPFVTRFEEAIRDYTDSPQAVACVNGTAALHVSLILSGIGRGEEVIVPTVTFIAPVNTIRYVGASPVFMDCDDYLNLDPTKIEEFLKRGCERSAKGVRNRATGRLVRAIVVVHVFGHPADMAFVLSLAGSYGLKVIEDATESIGSFTRGPDGQRRHTGTLGDFGCLSFNGNKLITTGGGGMILTSDAAAADRARHLTTQAKRNPMTFEHDAVGYNYRMTNLEAALGVAQMERLPRFLEVKRSNFQKYKEALAGIEGLRLIDEPPYGQSNFWHYALVVEGKKGLSRDRLLRLLNDSGIEARPLWGLNHQQAPYRDDFSYRIEKGEWFVERVLNLPCSVEITDSQIVRVAQVIRDSYGKN